MKIAVIGAGNVGRTLARRWADLGHEVVLGVRDPAAEKSRNTVAELGLEAKIPRDAALSADLVLLATPSDAAIEAAMGCGDLTGKIVVDATNPLQPQLDGLNHQDGISGAQRLAQAIPSARVVKAFNTIGFGIMEQPHVDGRRSVLFLSGDDDAAVDAVSALAAAMGFEPMRLGDLTASRMQEEHALLWIHLSFKRGLGRDFAFSICRATAADED